MSTPGASDDRPGGAAAPSIRVTGGSPTDEEIAAVAALFTQLALERAASVERVHGPEQRTAWDRTRRHLRTPLAQERRWRDL